MVKADQIIRITSDCPLIDSEISSLVIQKHACSTTYDYTSNTLKRSYPRGLDTEVFTFSSLEIAYHKAKDYHDREHVTPFIYNSSNQFNRQSVENTIAIPDYRWTLDTEEDWTPNLTDL